MENNTISREEELHIDHLEDDIDEMEGDDFVYNVCCCKDRLIEELRTKDRIRDVVMPRTVLYNADDIRKFLMLLSMYPSLASVSEVVEDITMYYTESEMD